MTDHDRWKCEDCDRIYHTRDLLQAPHPFEPGGTVTGCPHCKSVDSFNAACYVKKCTHDACCGTPTKAGYFWSCSEHVPKDEQ